MLQSRTWLILLCLALLALAAASCGSTLAEYELGHLSVNVSSVGDSQVLERELEVRTEPSLAGGYEVSVLRTSGEAASTALLELSFDPRFQASEVSADSRADAQLSLTVTDIPGLLAFGVILPAGKQLPTGELLRFHLSPAGAPRLTAKAPTAQGGPVTDLEASVNAGQIELNWSYVNLGDYNQDGAVSVADLSQIGIHFQKSGPWDYSSVESVVDGTPDGVISVADLTPIGINYQRKISGYALFSSPAELIEPGSLTELQQIDFAASSGGTSTRRRFSASLDSGSIDSAAWLVVQPFDSSDSTEGPFSNAVSASAGEDTEPPVWTGSPGILGALPGNQKVTAVWGEASDALSPPVSYTVYYQLGNSIEFATAETLVVAAPATQATVTGLSNGELYTFAVRAIDSAPLPNEDQNTVTLSATPAQGKTFAAPPPGTQTVDSLAGQSPQLVVFPAATDDAEAGAPAIFSLRTDAAPAGTHIYCARYTEGLWEETSILSSSSYSGLQALLIPDDQGALVFQLFTYDTVEGKLLNISFDQSLTLLNTREVWTNTNTAQTLGPLSVDYDASTGTFGVMSGFNDTSSGNLVFSQNLAGGDTFIGGLGVYSGDPVLSASFRFDPLGGQSWLAVSHGTVDTSSTVDFNVVAEIGRFDGFNTWTLSPLDYADDAVQVALSFAADNTPLLAFSAVRPVVVGPASADVLFDAVLGTYDGANWDFSTIYAASFNADIKILTTTITLSEVPVLSWAGSEELCLSELAGDIIVNNLNQQISGGQLDIQPRYRTAALSGYTQDSAYFNGDPGLGFDWASAPAGPAATYVSATSLSAADLLAGNLSANGPLLYWSGS